MDELKSCNTYDEFLKVYKKMYDQFGIISLSQKWQENKGFLTDYKRASRKGCSMEKVANELNILDEYIKFREKQRGGGNNPEKKWNEETIKVKVIEIIDKFGYIPSSEWLDKNGYKYINTYGQSIGGIDQLRIKFGDTNKINKLISRDGNKWDSFPEVCLANHLWSRGFNVFKGRKYPEEYSKFSGRSHGKYDLEFDATEDDYDGLRILVEVWGDYPNGARKEEYAITKQKKIEFNKDKVFLGIQYLSCFKEDELIPILKPFIGKPNIIRYVKDHDIHFKPLHWTLADEVLQTCKFVCENIEDHLLPTSDWFKRHKQYKDREIYYWEPVTWGRLPNKITQVGGIEKIRELLGQSKYNTIKLTEELAITKLKEFKSQYNCTPSSFLYNIKKKEVLSESDIEIKSLCIKLRYASEKFKINAALLN